MTLGEKLKELRLKKGLKVYEVAEKCNWPFQCIYAYERGAIGPSFRYLLRLVEELGESLAVFDGCTPPKDGRIKMHKNRKKSPE